MRILLQSTAVVVQFGPFVDKTDGNTYEIALAGTGANQLENTTTGIRISKNGGALAARSATATASTYDALGMYLVTLSTTDTGTLGQLRVAMNNNDALTVWEDFLVVPANVYNSIVLGTDILDVSITQLLGTAWLTPGVAGTPDVNAKLVGALAVVSGAIPNAVAGASSGLAIVGSSMVVPSTQKVDVETIKTQAVTCAAGVTVLPSVGAASAQTATLDTIKTETAGIEVHVHTTIPALLPAALGADGFIKASLFGAMGTALTETAGLIAAAIVKFFNKATPTGTINSLPDAVPGASGGLPTTNGTKVSQTVDLTASQEIAADITKIHGTAITETSGQLAAAFTKLFNVATPVLTCESVNQAGDAHVHADAIDTLTKASGPGDLAAILTDTAVIGALGAGLTALATQTSVDGIETHVHTTIPALLPTALVSGRIDASVGAVAANAIDAAAIKDGAIDNATFAADVGSTAFATNIIALAVFKALDNAITDAVSLTTGGLLEKIRRLTWVLTNQIEVTDANGNTVVYKDDSTTVAYTVNAALTDNSTTTTRLRMA